MSSTLPSTEPGSAAEAGVAGPAAADARVLDVDAGTVAQDPDVLTEVRTAGAGGEQSPSSFASSSAAPGSDPIADLSPTPATDSARAATSSPTTSTPESAPAYETASAAGALDAEAAAGPGAPPARGVSTAADSMGALAAQAPTTDLAASLDLTAHAPVTAGADLERALAAQLAARVGRLAQGPDGDYELSLQLEPADLGRLELRVRLEAGVVHVHVAAGSNATSDLLRDALPELRQALADAGLAAGQLDVGQQGSTPHRSPDRPQSDPAAEHRTTPARPTVPTPVPAVDRGVDVLL